MSGFVGASCAVCGAKCSTVRFGTVVTTEIPSGDHWILKEPIKSSIYLKHCAGETLILGTVTTIADDALTPIDHLPEPESIDTPKELEAV